MKIKNCILFFLFYLLWIASYASIVNKTLYINRGLFTTVDNTTFPALAFNVSNGFVPQNAVIKITTNDSLIVKVINNDSLVHGFNVKYVSGVNHLINPADSIVDTLYFSAQGVFIYYDNYLYPKNSYLGLAGMITVINSITDKKYYWNIKEHQTQYNNALSAGLNVNWLQYTPNYFTINAYSYPDLIADTSAKINVMLGDTVHIFIINSGNSSHSLHFHGFHSKVLYSSSSNMMVNSEKETFPLKPMEAVLLEMIPDKIGQYPVHDHNETALSGGGKYPNGMLLIMNVN